MHLLFVFGTRPEAIKMAPVILEARRRPGVRVTALSTGQHREMLRAVLGLFRLEPDVDLGLMRPGQTLPDLTARALTAVTDVLRAQRPDVVLVQGDTSTAMASALAAFYERIPVAHVEAGLRTDRLDAPFPEELNRRLIGQMAQWHFPPTERARAMLERDAIGVLGGRLVVTGNTVIDALHLAVECLRAEPPQDPLLRTVQEARAAGRRVVLVTGHRRENFGEPFREFCLGLRDIATAHPDVLLVYPVHLNPNVQAPVQELLSSTPNILLPAPADYPVFVALMQEAHFLITDSGGVQEEAPALGKPVLVTRDVTERPEAVEAGGVALVGPHREPLSRAARQLLTDAEHFARMARARSPYGDGGASRRIVSALLGEAVEPFASPATTPQA